MSAPSKNNPLIQPIRDSFDVKRGKKDGLIPRSWLLVILCILDMIADRDGPISEDDAYTYDYTLKNSRAGAIPKLLAKYSFPLKLGMGTEGITTRGAPGLRLFRAIEGGGVIANRPMAKRKLLLGEAIDLVRVEMLRVVGQGPVNIPFHRFDQTSTFVESLFEAVQNRSNGRVEQALVGAKLQLRYPNISVPNNPGFAGDRQTGRDCDFEVNNLRVIVSVSPKDQHFESAESLADQGRTVNLVVAEKSFLAAKKRIKRKSHKGEIIVSEVEHFVISNMSEISTDREIDAREMCLLLVKEYNRRIVVDNDDSLRVVEPQ
jgi:hypothetical protein